MTNVVKLKDSEAIAQEAARRWVEIANAAVKDRGTFRVALSGGTTPKRLYQLMTEPPFRDQVAWDKAQIFWGDERRVPPSHEDSSYRMAREMLLDHVPVPEANIFRMLGDGLAQNAVKDYETKIRSAFGLKPREWPDFDLFLLGMGADGHIASIFPRTRAFSDLSNMIIVYEVPQLRASRITVTRPVINHARHILILVSGEQKSKALAATLNGPHQPSAYPAQGIQPIDPNALTWLVDKAAASEL